jgi:flagellar biosynthesis anti-sigma factor FlgM
MKIDGYQVGKLYESYAGKNNQAAGVNQDTSKTDKADRVEISSKAANMNVAVSLGQKIASTDSFDERQTRIAELKKLIDAGQYNVSSKAVAQSILLGGNLDINA